jgi:uncharacterized Fe-S cluster-containing radical SAM superfamily protein
MFGFGKGSKVTAFIGAALHHQFYSAMREDEWYCYCSCIDTLGVNFKSSRCKSAYGAVA